MIGASALYRPLVMWADNAWDLSSPQKLFLLGFVTFAIGIIPYLALTTLGLRPIPIALGIAFILIILLHWNQIDILTPLAWLSLVVLGASIAHARVGDGAARAIALATMAVLGVAPAFQVVVSHVRNSEPYPIVDLAPRRPAEATGAVEDILLIIVDNYPSLAIAEEWFEHDTADLRTAMLAREIVVPEAGWSQHTFTGLAVASILELQPVAEPGPTGRWGNRLSSYQIIRGDSLVSATLRSAGYEYTHVESGWDASSCGSVDRCMESPFVDEIFWEFLRPTVLGSWMVSTYGSFTVRTTLRAVGHLTGLSALFNDGENDYVFAHLLLPHPPYVVDAQCDIQVADQSEVMDFDSENPGRNSRNRYDRQFSCVDTLLGEIADLAGSKTAVLISGDHGTGTGGQVGSPPDTWTDADIAERFGVLLAYRLPEACDSPEDFNNVEVMRAIMDCAVEMEMPDTTGMYLIGAMNPEWVDPNRMDAIKRRVADRSIQPD